MHLDTVQFDWVRKHFLDVPVRLELVSGGDRLPKRSGRGSQCALHAHSQTTEMHLQLIVFGKQFKSATNRELDHFTLCQNREKVSTFEF